MAYTQGTDIHIEPDRNGIWDMKPGMWCNKCRAGCSRRWELQGLAVNDNEDLEREADVMEKKRRKIPNKLKKWRK
ncbi:MAG: hypothetical protein V8S95_02140 [Odoribacter sp.]